MFTTASCCYNNSILKFAIVGFSIMKLWHSTFVFDYPWEQVVQAAYRKYPNPYNPSVVGTDVVERDVSCGKITTKKLIATVWNLPSLVTKIVGNCGLVYGNERSWLNRNDKLFTLRTQNVSLSNLITIDEKMTYSVNPENPNTTLLKQSAMIKVMGIPFLQGTLEDMTVKRFDSNAASGRQAIIDIVKEINKDKT